MRKYRIVKRKYTDYQDQECTYYYIQYRDFWYPGCWFKEQKFDGVRDKEVYLSTRLFDTEDEALEYIKHEKIRREKIKKNKTKECKTVVWSE